MITDKESALKWLDQFITKINEQDNRATAIPYIFVVQSLEFDRVIPENGSDDYNSSDQELEEEEDPNEPGEVLKCLYTYQDRAWFFTEEGANEHLMMNRHNYSKPRIYVKHCFRSPEIRDLLISIAKVVDKELRIK